MTLPLASPHWTHPGLADLAARGQALQAQLEIGQGMAAALQHLVEAMPAPHRDWPRFVPVHDWPPNTPYEAFIRAQRAVPTRDNWHDGFNALCWLRLPALKWHFNQLQAEVIEREGIRAHRGPVRDAVTVFDENGLFLQAPDALWAAIVAREWRHAFVDLQSLWAQCRWVILGHALLDNLSQPFKGITAHVLRWPMEWGADETVLADRMVNLLTPEVLARKPFVPLPVMGMPGWMAGQDAPGFFLDETVFRPMHRQREPAKPGAGKRQTPLHERQIDL